MGKVTNKPNAHSQKLITDNYTLLYVRSSLLLVYLQATVTLIVQYNLRPSCAPTRHAYLLEGYMKHHVILKLILVTVKLGIFGHFHSFFNNN